MNIALLMPPLATGQRGANSMFRFLHDCARARPYWNSSLYPLTSKMKLFDFDYYPSSLVQLGTVLKAKHRVKIFNFLEQDYYQQVLDFKPDIIGISCSGGGNLVWVDTITRAFKKKTSAKIFLGGPHVSLTPGETLNTTVADYVFTGESDLVISQVVDYIDGKVTTLPAEGVCYRQEGEIIVNPPAIVEDLSALPIPDHSLMNLDKYKSIGMEFSRGCPFDCSFCYLSGYSRKMHWRHRPVESMLREIEALSQLTDISQKRIYFLDVNFSGNNASLRTLLEEIIKRRIKISFWTGLDINIDYETLCLMKEAGCSFLYTGIETGAVARMAGLSKVQNYQKIEDFIRRVKKAGISPSFNVILLLPGETKEELQDTLYLCRKISRIRFGSQERLINLSFYPHIFRPVPGTKSAQQLIKQGWKMPDTFLGWGLLYNDISNGRFQKANFSKDLKKIDIVLALMEIALLNIRQIFRPGIFKYLYNKISSRR